MSRSYSLWNAVSLDLFRITSILSNFLIPFNEAPYVPSLLVEFRKRLDDEILAQINEMIIEYNTPDDSDPGSGGKSSDGSFEGFENYRTVILDATCVLRNISYPQRVLADKIYRNRENLAFCRQHVIRLSVSTLGRSRKNSIANKKTEYTDNAQHVEIERAFSLA